MNRVTAYLTAQELLSSSSAVTTTFTADELAVLLSGAARNLIAACTICDTHPGCAVSIIDRGCVTPELFEEANCPFDGSQYTPLWLAVEFIKCEKYYGSKVWSVAQTMAQPALFQGLPCRCGHLLPAEDDDVED